MATDPLGRIQPKLLDFGIAKVGPGNFDARLTQVGVVLGSPEYMSPEQALGVDDVDERTDVWSVAIVLYEMVTGNVPFKRANYNALMQAIIHEPPKPMTEFAEGDESLWRVVERGLAKDREQRWSTMAGLGEALALWLYEHGIKEDICGNSIRAVWLDGLQSGVKVETIPTVPPKHETGHLARSKYSASARTVERQRYRSTQPSIREVRQRRVVVVATVFGAILGGVIAGLLLRNGSKEPTPITAVTTASVAFTPETPKAETTGRQWDEMAPNRTPMAKKNEEAAIPVEALEKETDGVVSGSASNSKARGTGTTTNAKKPAVKGSKRRHDFGF
jgi:serine/threonine-protein kinase